MHCTDCSQPIESCICGSFSRFKDSPEERQLRNFFCRRMPEVGDNGQRYEVRFVDENGAEKVMGWSESYPQNYVDAINVHPVWHSPKVIDRKPARNKR
jgi:hypothetical protein